jgi:DNA-binding CsgD family transcriptional regulator
MEAVTQAPNSHVRGCAVERLTPAARASAVAVPAPRLSPWPAEAQALCRVVIDQLDFGIMIVGRDGSVVLSNRAAERECNSATFVTVEAGRLRARPYLTLMQALEEALNGFRRLVSLSADGEALPVMVVPLVTRQTQRDALAMVVFGRRRLADPIVTDMYARSRHLTGVQAAILRGLSEGCLPRECSSKAGVSLATVRSHLSAAREKLGAGSIDELLHIMGCLPPTAPALYSCN